MPVALKHLRNKLGQYLYVVHRLDRPTCGVLIFALNKDVQSKLSILFQTWKVKKVYHAVVLGETNAEGEVDLPVQRNEESDAMPSYTFYKRLNFIQKGKLADAAFSYLEVHPKTGRHHQIRRHLSWTGFPIFCDYLYGDIETNEKLADQTVFRAHGYRGRFARVHRRCY